MSVFAFLEKDKETMQMDFNRLNQDGEFDMLLNSISYPVNREELIAEAESTNVNPMIVNALRRLSPGTLFRSSEDIKKNLRQQVGQR